MPQKILIDCDPGIDDTLALLLALRSPELEVVGVTTVFGNGPASVTALNARRVLEIAGREDIPVAAGADQPLVRPPRASAPEVHGSDGLGNTFLPPPRIPPLAQSAAEFICAQAQAQPGEITLVALGPQTNLGLALRLRPDLPRLARGVVFMGGAARMPGNVTPTAEANIHGDPEAAAMVLDADWPAVMVGLDVTTRTLMPPELMEALGRGSTPAAELMRGMFPVYQGFYNMWYGLGGATHTHDPSAIAYLIDPGLFRTERWPVYVETQGRCAGQTVPDPRKVFGERPVQTVCVDVDSAGVLALIRSRLAD